MLSSESVVPTHGDRLKTTASNIFSRMQSLGLNETHLSEQCSLAALPILDECCVPALTRDRVSKILMNRHDAPAKSAARIISHGELEVLASVLKVSVEWLTGQGQSLDPVLWNVLAEPDRALKFAHLLQEYEEVCKHASVWSRHPKDSFTSEAFVHAFNQVQYGKKPGLSNTRPLVEFYDKVARIRRKWLLRPDRSFDYTNLIFQSDFERTTCGTGAYAAISKSILRRNLDVMIDVITNAALRLKLVILKDKGGVAGDGLQDYETLGAVDCLISVWTYHNGDVAWSEHLTYARRHRQLLDRLLPHSLCRDVNETVAYIESLRRRLG